MAKGKNQHVVPHLDGWAVIGAGNTKATKVTRTQKEAIVVAEEIARNQQSDTKIHGTDGKIRAGNSYGNDLYPPKDKK
jgi:hypothetical protein